MYFYNYLWQVFLSFIFKGKEWFRRNSKAARKQFSVPVSHLILIFNVAHAENNEVAFAYGCSFKTIITTR